MPVTPSVLIIEKSRFPANVPLEECERLGKTANNEDAVIRFQRPSKVDFLERVGRFFSDLFHGVTRARGILCDQPERMPTIIHIRGHRCLVEKSTKIPNIPVYVRRDATAKETGSTPTASFSGLRIEVREAARALAWRDEALASKMAEQLQDRFEAHGMTADLFAVKTFLKVDARPELALTPKHVLHLMRFSDVLTTLAGPLKEELSPEVQSYLLRTLEGLQNAIGSLRASDQAGAARLYPDLKFSALSAFRTQQPAVTASVTATALPATAATSVPAAIPDTATANANASVLATTAAAAPSLPEPTVASRAPSRPVPPPVAQATQAAEAAQAAQATQIAPLAPPPPPPGAPPSIKRPSPAAAPTLPDTDALAAAKTRLKPASPGTQARQAAAATDAHALGSILAKAMSQRRSSLESEPRQQGNDRSEDRNDDEWQ